MMGHLGTPTTKAIKDYLDEKRVPNIFPATLASMWTTSGKWHIGDLATYTDQTGLIVDYLVKEKKIRKIASFYQDDEYGLDGHLGGKSRLKHTTTFPTWPRWTTSGPTSTSARRPRS